ncbi:DUF6453 family protein [Escherichia coli]|nr:DUF6453 family protein [Escherichia coli]
MPNGLYINYNDGRPPMEITAGMKCPSLCQDFGGYDDRRETIIPEILQGGTPFFTTDYTASYFPPTGVGIIGAISYLNKVSFDGTLMRQEVKSNGTVLNSMVSGQVWQIFPASTPQGNRGLLIADSTDFTAITDTSKIATCVFSGWVHINGEYTLPADGLVFAKWNHAEATLTKKSGKILAYRNYKDSGDFSIELDVYIAIFSVSSPVPGTGLNIFNAAGQCTFSTTRKPLILGGFRVFNSDWQDVGNNMVLLGTNGYESSSHGGWCRLRKRGLMMSGNSIKTGNSKTRSIWTSQYAIISSANSNMSIPLIPYIY